MQSQHAESKLHVCNCMCRSGAAMQEASLWACLAGWAVAAGELNTAEVAFAGCEEVDKLQYMLYIKQLPTRESRLAELALYKHNVAEAEAILLQVKTHINQKLAVRCLHASCCMAGKDCSCFTTCHVVLHQHAIHKVCGLPACGSSPNGWSSQLHCRPGCVCMMKQYLCCR